LSKLTHYRTCFKIHQIKSIIGVDEVKIFITGANTGIGFATAEELLKQGQHVILACRNPQKAQAAQDKLRALGQGQVDLVSLDLNSLESTRNTADEIADRYGSLDVLINNAGLFAKTKQLTQDGFEQQFGVNYLGHFLLTHKLIPVLEQAPKARIVHLASIAHWAGSIKPNKFRAEGFYNPLFYYGQSKLANLLFSNALAERMANSTITNNALHPGGVASDIYRELPKPVYEVMKIGLVPTSVPAKLITQMATGDDWAKRNGEYVSAHMPDWKSPHAKNQQLARDLYTQSMNLVEKYL
jgi:NAD(P)-dependent dehydrogenase (short-subunit alcohol dehydrogenase family)